MGTYRGIPTPSSPPFFPANFIDYAHRDTFACQVMDTSEFVGFWIQSAQRKSINVRNSVRSQMHSHNYRIHTHPPTHPPTPPTLRVFMTVSFPFPRHMSHCSVVVSFPLFGYHILNTGGENGLVDVALTLSHLPRFFFCFLQVYCAVFSPFVYS